MQFEIFLDGGCVAVIELKDDATLADARNEIQADAVEDASLPQNGEFFFSWPTSGGNSVRVPSRKEGVRKAKEAGREQARRIDISLAVGGGVGGVGAGGGDAVAAAAAGDVEAAASFSSAAPGAPQNPSSSSAPPPPPPSATASAGASDSQMTEMGAKSGGGSSSSSSSSVIPVRVEFSDRSVVQVEVQPSDTLDNLYQVIYQSFTARASSLSGMPIGGHYTPGQVAVWVTTADNCTRGPVRPLSAKDGDSVSLEALGLIHDFRECIRHDDEAAASSSSSSSAGSSSSAVAAQRTGVSSGRLSAIVVARPAATGKPADPYRVRQRKDGKRRV